MIFYIFIKILRNEKLFSNSTNLFKEIVDLVSSDPPLIELHVQFPTVSFKALSDQVWIRYQRFCFGELIIFIFVSDIAPF